MAQDKGFGYVYIMTNPSFKENIIKVGMTTNLEQRKRDLSMATGVPTPFEIYAVMRTKHYREVEIALHNILEKVVHNRVNKNREFFELPPEEAYFLMKQLEPFVDDAEITLATEQKDNTFTPDKNVHKKYEKADQVMTAMEVLPFEGQYETHDLYHDIKMSLAHQCLDKKQYKRAIKYAEEAKLWPTHLGVGKPYEVNNEKEDQFIKSVREKMK